MATSDTESDFVAVFRARTRQAREAADLTQRDVATVLGVELDTYKKWENRPGTSIPREKLLAFCLLTRIAPEAMLAAPTPSELGTVRPPRRKRA